MNNKKQLGNSNLLISPLTFGGNVFGWTLDEQASFKILDDFIAAGFNFLIRLTLTQDGCPEIRVANQKPLSEIGYQKMVNEKM